MSYRVEPDGTRVYKNGHRYKPLSPEERTYRSLKPADADERGAIRFHGTWWYPLDVLPDDERVLPFTRPDSEGYLHDFGCRCLVCKDNKRVLAKKRRQVYKGGTAKKFRDG